MPKTTTPRKKKEPEVIVRFANKPCPTLLRLFKQGVISENLRAHIPPNQQRALLDRFVEAGYMAP